MKVYVYPADETGCGYYRLIWPAMAAQQLGADVTIVGKKDLDRQFQGVMVSGRLIDVKLPEDCDVVVLQRPTHIYLQQAIPLIRRKGIAVVIDMDDDLTTIDPRNPAFSALHPKANGEHSWANTRTACEQATLITVSTDPLLDVYARRTTGVTLKNYVPRFFTEIPHEDSAVVGWGGSIHSHPDDLQTMGSAVARITREARFTVVGPEKDVAAVLGSSVAERISITGPVEFGGWPRALATNLGVGVAPTSDTKFNRAKSWLKPLEYASVGVPCVSSARPEYAELCERYGVGQLASSPKEWYRKVMQLVRNESVRRELGASSRAFVADHLTIEAHAHRWIETWEQALQIQRSGAQKPI